ncbi:MAG: hypothetical protein H6733_14675 [Alphaproteobacteria bacterium]|nr:hypothetical protein [Alphaproteobacteria bacterium]
MAMVEFDPEVVIQHARQLYDDARKIVWSWLMMGALVGIAVGAAATGFRSAGTVVAAVVMAAMGYVMGNDRAGRMRLEAQLAMCQIRIEENTRAAVAQTRLVLTKVSERAPSEAPVAPESEASSSLAAIRPSPAKQRAMMRQAAAARPQPAVNHPADDEDLPAWAVQEPVSHAFETGSFRYVVAEHDVAATKPAPMPAGGLTEDQMAALAAEESQAVESMHTKG